MRKLFIGAAVGAVALAATIVATISPASASSAEPLPLAQTANVMALPNAPVGALRIVPGISYTATHKVLVPLPDEGTRWWAAPKPLTCGAANCAGWQWQSESYTEQFVADSARQYMKIVAGVIAYRPFDDQTNNSVQQLNAQCQVRNLNTAYVSGVKITRCALGIDGGAAVSVNENDVLDGGGCCANSQAFPVAAHFCSFCNSFRGRTSAALRWIPDGKLYNYDTLSKPTDRAFALG